MQQEIDGNEGNGSITAGWVQCDTAGWQSAPTGVKPYVLGLEKASRKPMDVAQDGRHIRTRMMIR